MSEPDVGQRGADTDEDFEELRVFLQGQRARHRRMIAIMLAGGLVLAAAGIALLLVRPEGSVRIAGVFLVGLGGLGVARGLLSALTDIDTKDRGEFEAMQAELERDIEKKVGGEP